MSPARFGSVDEYFDSLPAQQGKTLRAIVDLVVAEFPGLEVKLAWNVPQVHRDGQYVFGVSALKRHLALAPWSEDVITRFRERLEQEGYVVRKNLFQVPDGWPIDRGLVKDLVQARLTELDETG